MSQTYTDSKILSIYRSMLDYMCLDLMNQNVQISVKEVRELTKTKKFMNVMYNRYFKYTKHGREVFERQQFVTFLNRYFHELAHLCEDEEFLAYANVKCQADGVILIQSLSEYPEFYAQKKRKVS